MKNYSLLICDTQEFLKKRNKIIKIEATDHSAALDYFIDNYDEEIINKTIMTFCYEESARKYGYLYGNSH